MARRRLTPVTEAPSAPPLAAPPIARVAGEAAAQSALREVASELAMARADGRLALRLPLGQIEDGWLVRDRLAPEGEEFEALLASLRAHGQRAALEVAELGPDRYGLISGWRRLTALRRLHTATGEARFATALAVLRRPDTAAAAYLSMVEENEIRAGLSHYERARIVARAAEAGVFPDDRAALAALFGAASKARRSKIGAFVGVYRALDGVLRFPAALPERLGLSLARALEADPALPRRLRGVLARSAPASAEAELAALAAALAEPPAQPPAAPPEGPARPQEAAPADAGPEDAGPRTTPERSARQRPVATADLRPGLRLEAGPGRIVLSGPAIDAGFRARLEAWLRHGDPA